MTTSLLLDFRDGLAGWHNPCVSKPYFVNEVGALEFTNTAAYRGLEYPYAFTNGTIEMRARVHPTSDAYLTLRFMMNQGGDVCGGTYNGYMLQLHRASAMHTFARTNTAGGNRFATVYVAFSDGDWHNWLITKAGNNFTLDFDGGGISAGADATYATSDRFGIAVYAGTLGSWEIDWILITPG